MTDRRFRLALLAYACLVAQISAFAHRVLVQHVTCAEHGEAIHLGAAGPSSQVGVLLGGDGLWPHIEERSMPRAGGVPVAVGDEHDHCSVAASRPLTLTSILDGAVGLAACAGHVAEPGAADAGPFVAPYRIAPKTSPPGRV